MKILELLFHSYGPFNNKRLDLSGGEQGFHLIFGANESGKTTALRGLTSLLFGAGKENADGLHRDFPHLKIGGRLQSASGAVLGFSRELPGEDSLIAENGEPLSEEALRQFLGGIRPRLFRTAFALSHLDLVRGGEELLADAGELGFGLLAAGSGLLGARAIIGDLASQADRLFKADDSASEICRLLAEHDDIDRDIDSKVVEVSLWKKLVNDINKTKEKLKEKESEKIAVAQEINKLERVRKSLKPSTRCAAVEAELLELKYIPEIPDNFSERLRKASSEQEALGPELDSLPAELEKLKREERAIAVPDDLLSQEELVLSLYRKLGLTIRDEEKIPELQKSHRRAMEEAQSLLSGIQPDLGLEEVESLRICESTRARIRSLSDEYGLMNERLRRAAAELKEKEAKLAAERARLQDLPRPADLSPLQEAVGEARKLGDQEQALQSVNLDMDRAEHELEAMLDSLGLVDGNIEALRGFKAPSEETFNRFEEMFHKADLHAARLEERLAEQTGRLREAESRISALSIDHGIPSEDKLLEAREQRDRIWRDVKAALMRDVLSATETSHIFEEDDKVRVVEFEEALREADEVGDRLRREADKVKELSILDAEVRRLKKDILEIEAGLDKVGRHRQQILEMWEGEWQGLPVDVSTPADMRAWARGYGELLAKLRELDKLRSEAARLGDEIERRRSRIIEVAKPLGLDGPLISLSLRDQLKECGLLFGQYEEAAEERGSVESLARRLEDERVRAESELRELRDKQRQWKEEWREVAAEIGLKEEDAPEMAVVILDDIESLFKKLDEAKSLNAEIEEAKHSIAVFEEEARMLLGNVARDLLYIPSEQAVGALHRRLGEAKENAVRKRALAERIEEKSSRLEELERRHRALRQELDLLCVRAGCLEPKDLEAHERLSIRKKELLREKRELLDTLEGIAGEAGWTTEQLVEAVKEADADAIPARIEVLAETAALAAEESDSLRKRLWELQQRLERIDGRADVARLAQKREMILADLRARSLSYARLTAARLLMQAAIDRFSEKHHQSFIRRAGELFRDITCGAFARLTVSPDPAGRQVFKALRSNGEETTVEVMSDGTRDQLFLALRFAGFDTVFSGAEPLPLILDDTLINFDDDRARATLRVLDSLTPRHQVIFFTHHDHLRRLAESTISKEQYFVQEL